MDNRFFILLMACAALFLVQCKDDEGGNSYDFKNQELQGKIGGTNWTLGSAKAEASGFNAGEIDFEMYNHDSTDVCNSFFGDGDRLFFDLPDMVGLYELNFDFSGGTSETVTFFVDAQTLNNIASEGAIELLTIDTAAGTVSGRMDVRFDDDNFVNGNFSAEWCN